MKNHKKHKDGPQKAKFKPGSKKRENKCVVMFDDKAREDYLTGFHKRKVERRKTAVEEIKQKIKEEKSKVREERHKEYIKMLKERTEALADAEDDLEDVVISKTESIQYNHPNHTVTVTTISDLDLSGTHLIRQPANHADGQSDDEDNDEEEEKTPSLPKKAKDPIMNKKIRSLTAALSTFTSKRKRKGKRKGKGKQEGRQGCRTDGRPTDTESNHRSGRTSKRQRRRQTGRKTKHQD